MVQYSKLAGTRALAAYAYEEALGHFQRALTAREGPATPSRRAEDAETAELLHGLGRARSAVALSLDQRQEGFDNLCRALDYYVEEGDVPQAVAVAGPAMLQPGLTGISRFFTRALTVVSPDSHDAGLLISRLGLALWLEMGDEAGAQDAFRKALVIAQRENDTALEAWASTIASSVDWQNLRYEQSLERNLRAIELAGRADEAPAERHARLFASWLLLAMGDLEGARAHAEASLALSERLRERRFIVSALRINQLVSQAEGDWSTARDFSDRALAMERSLWGLGDRALLEYQMGDFRQGDTYLEQLIEAHRLVRSGIWSESSVPAVMIPLMARISGVEDRFDVAEEDANTVLSSSNVAPLLATSASAGLALMAVQRGDAGAAGTQYDALVSQRGTMLGLSSAMCVDHLLGLLAQTTGQSDKAAPHLEDALAFCRKAGYRPELAWSLCDYADMLRERNDGGDRQKAATLLDESLAISGELGMRPLMERVLSRKMSLQGIDVSSLQTSIDAVVSAVEVERPNLQPHAAPDGTVTVMFTDIEGSTAMYERLGDARAQEVLHTHNAIIREQVAAHHGFEVKSQGDGFMLAFSSARRALECAIAIQQAFVAHNAENPGEPIRVRIGLHTGEAIKEGEDFFGKTVIVAGRSASEAQGDQILVSSLLKALVESSGEFQFAQGRDMELKGMTGSHQVLGVRWRGKA